MVDQIQQEINPFSLAVPDSLRNLDPDLHEYLLRLNRTLKQQHNQRQAGDTTFDWVVLLGLDSLARYTPGSLGSFSHPVYGLIRARYVRFRATNKNTQARVAGFARGAAGLEWEVVNDRSKAQDSRPLGIIAAESVPLVGEYGWVITEGTNLAPLYVDAKPAPGGIISWGSGALGQFLGTAATKVGDLWEIPTATLRIRLEAGSGGEAGGFGPGSIENVAFEYGKQIVELENRLDLVTDSTKAFISILSRRVSELTEDRASLQLLDMIQAGANWMNLAGVSAFNAEKYARDGQISALATQSYLRDSKVYRDEAGFYAASSIEFRNSASINAAEASVSAGQAAESSLTAAGYTAQALQYVTLAASVGDNLLKNGTFSDPRWEENQGIPPEWQAWATGFGYPTIRRASPGQYGPYALLMENDASQHQVGIMQDVTMTPGKYLLGADVFYRSGTFDNSGLLIQYFAPDNTYLGQEGVRFLTEARVDSTDAILYNIPKTLTYSKPITAPAGTSRGRVYLMNRWDGWGDTVDGTQATYNRVYLRKPAYSDSQGSQAYTDARINEVKQALATESDARVNLATSADTRFKNVNDSITTVNGRVTTVIDSLTEYDRRITAASTAAGSAITATESLKARFSKGGGEAGLNSYFSDPWDSGRIPPQWAFWGGDINNQDRGTSSPYGPYFVVSARAPNSVQGIMQGFPLLPGTWTLACDVLFASGDAAGSGILIQYFNASGGYITQDAIIFDRTPRSDGLVGGLEQSKIYSYAFPFTVPIGTTNARIYLMAGWDGFGLNPNPLTIFWYYAGVRKQGNERRYVDASVKTVSDAVATEREARASQYTDISTTLNGQANTLRIYGESIDGVKAKWGVKINPNNKVVTGIELVGGTDSTDFILAVDRFRMDTPGGQVTPFEATANQFRLGVDLFVGRYKIILDTGSVMLVMGLGFGNANQFIMWFGPSMNPAGCSESNGIFYLTLGGSAYFGGTLNAGIITNARRTTQTDPVVGVTTGTFGSNGKSRVVTVSYNLTATSVVTGACPANPGTPRVDVSLYKGTDGSGQLLTTQTINGQYVCEPGQSANEPGYRTNTIQGSFTVTDNSGGPSASYYAVTSNRVTPVAGGLQQTLGLISVEQ